MGLQRLRVAARYSEAAVFNGVVSLAGMVPECDAADIAETRASHRPCSRLRHSSTSRHDLAAPPATRWRAS